MAPKSSAGLDAGGVAAIVFAILIVVMILVAIVFFAINKSEIAYMKPFRSVA